MSCENERAELQVLIDILPEWHTDSYYAVQTRIDLGAHCPDRPSTHAQNLATEFNPRATKDEVEARRAKTYAINKKRADGVISRHRKLLERHAQRLAEPDHGSAKSE